MSLILFLLFCHPYYVLTDNSFYGMDVPLQTEGSLQYIKISLLYSHISIFLCTFLVTLTSHVYQKIPFPGFSWPRTHTKELKWWIVVLLGALSVALLPYAALGLLIQAQSSMHTHILICYNHLFWAHLSKKFWFNLHWILTSQEESKERKTIVQCNVNIEEGHPTWSGAIERAWIKDA